MKTKIHPKVDLTENQVVGLWQDLLASGVELTAESGEPLQIMYPGRLNEERGADLRDVVISSRRGIDRGQIEFHVRSSDWRAHRHHLDPAYRNVILHVVFWDDTAPIQNQDRYIPTLSLRRYLDISLLRSLRLGEIPENAVVSCRLKSNFTTEQILSFVESAGEARFQEKAARFSQELQREDPGQVLFRGIMGALGYTKNKQPCRELADRVPLAELDAAAHSGGYVTDSLNEILALLLGTAGLLQSQHGGRTDNYAECLESIWQKQSSTAEAAFKAFRNHSNAGVSLSSQYHVPLCGINTGQALEVAKDTRSVGWPISTGTINPLIPDTAPIQFVHAGSSTLRYFDTSTSSVTASCVSSCCSGENIGHVSNRTMSISDWSMYKVRPVNSPVRRLAAAAYLIMRYREKGLLKSLLEQVEDRLVAKSYLLRDGFVVPAEGYWLNHFDFGLVSPKPMPSLVGPDRAAEITVNVIWPFAYSLGKLDSNGGLAAKATELYRHLPGSPANVLEKHMASQFGLSGKIISSALRQQGLLHIYRAFCIQGKCGECTVHVGKTLSF